MTSSVSGISTLSNSAFSFQENSGAVSAEKRAWGSKNCTTWTQLAQPTRIRNFGLESALSSPGPVSTRSGSLTRGRHLAPSSAQSLWQDGAFSRLGYMCASSERSAGMAVEESLSDESTDKFVEVVHKLADAARVITLKYFRSKFQIIDKADLSEYLEEAFILLRNTLLCSKKLRSLH